MPTTTEKATETGPAEAKKPSKAESTEDRIKDLEDQVERLTEQFHEHVHRLRGIQNYVDRAVRIKDGLFEALNRR